MRCIAPKVLRKWRARSIGFARSHSPRLRRQRRGFRGVHGVRWRDMAGHQGGARDYSQTPLNIYWEMTQACALACRHCRAEAVPMPHPMELTFKEGVAFLKQIPEFGNPMPQLIL